MTDILSRDIIFQLTQSSGIVEYSQPGPRLSMMLFLYVTLRDCVGKELIAIFHTLPTFRRMIFLGVPIFICADSLRLNRSLLCNEHAGFRHFPRFKPASSATPNAIAAQSISDRPLAIAAKNRSCSKLATGMGT